MSTRHPQSRNALWVFLFGKTPGRGNLSGQEGGEAVARVLFGEYNPAGKLPITFYKNSEQLPDFKDYSMKGRTLSGQHRQ